MDEERLRFEIATIVMGLEVYQDNDGLYEHLIDFANYNSDLDMEIDIDGYWYELPDYPYTMSDAWIVVEQLHQPHFNPVVRDKFGEWAEKIQIWTLPEEKAATLICRAILTLYGLQNEKEVDDYAIGEYN